MKLLFLDIETFPGTGHFWRTREENITPAMIIQPGEVACWSAFWYGSDDVYFDSLNQSTRLEMLTGIHDLIDEADAIGTYNGKRFDIPWLQGEWAREGIAPPSPYKHIDLFQTVIRQFKFPSYKLEYVAPALGIGHKVENEGFPLWTKCMEGDQDAWRRMEEYNIQDTLLLERLYERILPYIMGHPNLSVLLGDLVCPHCGSKHYHGRGYYLTNAGKYNKLQCQDCRKWFRGNKNLAAGKDKFISV